MTSHQLTELGFSVKNHKRIEHFSDDELLGAFQHIFQVAVFSCVFFCKTLASLLRASLPARDQLYDPETFHATHAVDTNAIAKKKLILK